MLELSLAQLLFPQNETSNIHTCCWHFQIVIYPEILMRSLSTLDPLAASLCCNVQHPSSVARPLLLPQASAKRAHDVGTCYRTHTVSLCVSLCVCVSVHSSWCKDLKTIVFTENLGTATLDLSSETAEKGNRSPETGTCYQLEYLEGLSW